MCAGGQEDDVFKNNGIPENIPVIGAIVSVSLLLIIATAAVILVLLWLRRRKVKTELADNVAYNSHSSECEIKTDANAAYHTVNNDDVTTATNAAYHTVNNDDVTTATNAAYAAVPSTSGDNDVVVTSTNEAYVPTGIATSVNAVKNDTPPVKSDTLQYDYVPIL